MKYLLWLVPLALVLAFWGLVRERDSRILAERTLRDERVASADAQKQANMRQEKDRSTLMAREADRRAIKLKLAQAEFSLQTALGANKTWSDTNVPTEVQSLILGPSSGLAGGSTGMSDPSPADQDY